MSATIDAACHTRFAYRLLQAVKKIDGEVYQTWLLSQIARPVQYYLRRASAFDIWCLARAGSQECRGHSRVEPATASTELYGHCTVVPIGGVSVNDTEMNVNLED